MINNLYIILASLLLTACMTSTNKVAQTNNTQTPSTSQDEAWLSYKEGNYDKAATLYKDRLASVETSNLEWLKATLGLAQVHLSSDPSLRNIKKANILVTRLKPMETQFQSNSLLMAYIASVEQLIAVETTNNNLNKKIKQLINSKKTNDTSTQELAAINEDIIFFNDDDISIDEEIKSRDKEIVQLRLKLKKLKNLMLNR